MRPASISTLRRSRARRRMADDRALAATRTATPCSQLATDSRRAIEPALPGQDEEGGLRGVLGLVLVAEDLAADAEDHRPMPLDQRREGGLGRRLARLVGEPAEELAVGQARGRPVAEERRDVPECGRCCVACHRVVAPARVGFRPVVPAAAPIIPDRRRIFPGTADEGVAAGGREVSWAVGDLTKSRVVIGQLAHGAGQPDREDSARMSETRRSLLAYFAAMAACGALLVGPARALAGRPPRAVRLRRRRPLCADLGEGGGRERLVPREPLARRPVRMEMHDFPLADGLFFLLPPRPRARHRRYVVALNLYYFSTYFLATASALFALRRLGVARGPAVVCGLLYAFLHYHFFRGEAHLFLASYFLVPLAAMVCLWLYPRRRAALPRARGGTGRGSRLGSRRAVAALAICVLLGSGGIYYASFTCYLLLVAGLCAAATRRRWHPIGSAAILVGLVVAAAGSANIAPTLIYGSAHGPNPAAVVALSGARRTLGPPDHAAAPAGAGAPDRRPGRAPASVRPRRRRSSRGTATRPRSASSAGLGSSACSASLLLRRRSGPPRLVDGLAALNLAAAAAGDGRRPRGDLRLRRHPADPLLQPDQRLPRLLRPGGRGARPDARRPVGEARMAQARGALRAGGGARRGHPRPDAAAARPRLRGLRKPSTPATPSSSAGSSRRCRPGSMVFQLPLHRIPRGPRARRRWAPTTTAAPTSIRRRSAGASAR